MMIPDCRFINCQTQNLHVYLYNWPTNEEVKIAYFRLVNPLKPVLRNRIRMFLGLPDPDPLIWGTDSYLTPDPDPFIIMQNSKRNLYSYYFVTSLRLFIFEQ